jgi:hypothetical protein
LLLLALGTDVAAVGVAVGDAALSFISVDSGVVNIIVAAEKLSL